MTWGDDWDAEESGQISERDLSGEIDTEEDDDAIAALQETCAASLGRLPREPWDADPDEDDGAYGDGVSRHDRAD